MKINSDYQIKHIYIDNQLVMYKLFTWNKFACAIKFNKKDSNIHVYTHKSVSNVILESYIKNHLLKYYDILIERKVNQRVSKDFSYIYLLNEKYSISIVQTQNRRKYEIFGRNIYLHCAKSIDKVFLIKKILLDYSKTYITPLFAKWMHKMNLTNIKLDFRWMVSRYGVYHSTTHKVTLGLQSITYRQEVIEYLIVHELAHAIHFNHQQAFWNCVEQYIPNWKILDKELLKNNLDYLHIE